MRYAFPYLHFNAICFVLAASAVLAASIAVWAGTSRRHWFWRVLAIWLAAIAPIPIRAYELAGILAITLPLLAITINFLNHFHSRDQTWSRSTTIRFPLRDIFLLTLGTALATAAVLHWWRDVNQLGTISGGRHWGALLVQFTLAGAAFWILTLLAWLTVAHYRVLGAFALFVAIPAFAFAIPIVGKMTLFGIRFDYLPPWLALGIYFNPGPLGPAPFILILVFTEFTIGLIATLAITKRLTSHHSPLTYSRLFLALPLLLLAVAYPKMIWLTLLPPRFSDAPNNYPRLIEIAQESERLARPPFAPANQQQAALIEEAAVLFQADNYIPYEPILVAKNPDSLNHLFVGDKDRLRTFAKRIDEEAAASLSRGDPSQALDYALSNIRSGLMLQRGATYFDIMFGNDTHFLAQKRLAVLRRDLSSDDARRLIEAIEDALNQAEVASAVVVRSRAFTERTYGWTERLHHVIEDFGLGGTGFDDATNLHASIQRRESIFRLLQTDLALRLYQHEHGTWPQNLDQLAPDYLSKPPIDPHSGRPFFYKPSADDFLLYSVGKDRIDNGGRFTSAGAFNRFFGGRIEDPGYDFDLDCLIRP